MTNPDVVRRIASEIQPGTKFDSVQKVVFDYGTTSRTTETVANLHDAELPDSVRAELDETDLVRGLYYGVATKRVTEPKPGESADDTFAFAIAQTEEGEATIGVSIQPAGHRAEIDPEIAQGTLEVVTAEVGIDRARLVGVGEDISPGLAEVIGFTQEPDGGYVFDRAAAA